MGCVWNKRCSIFGCMSCVWYTIHNVVCRYTYIHRDGMLLHNIGLLGFFDPNYRLWFVENRLEVGNNNSYFILDTNKNCVLFLTKN